MLNAALISYKTNGNKVSSAAMKKETQFILVLKLQIKLIAMFRLKKLQWTCTRNNFNEKIGLMS